MLFREILAFYSENHMTPMKTRILWPTAELLNVKTGGPYSLLLFFEGLKDTISD
jgi:hypothetical protein